MTTVAASTGRARAYGGGVVVAVFVAWAEACVGAAAIYSCEVGEGPDMPIGWVLGFLSFVPLVLMNAAAVSLGVWATRALARRTGIRARWLAWLPVVALLLVAWLYWAVWATDPATNSSCPDGVPPWGPSWLPS